MKHIHSSCWPGCLSFIHTSKLALRNVYLNLCRHTHMAQDQHLGKKNILKPTAFFDLQLLTFQISPSTAGLPARYFFWLE